MAPPDQAGEGGGRLVLRVRRVQAGCSFPAGMVSPPFARRFVIGRSPHADLRLDDPSISTEHLALTPRVGGMTVENLSANGTTFLNEQAMTPGERSAVAAEIAWVQIGRALIEVSSAPQTIPIHERIAPPSTRPPADRAPLVRIQLEGSLQVYLADQPVQLYPMAARVLVRLCESAGQLVPHGDLLLAMDPDYAGKAGGGNVAQSVTYLRDLFERAIADGHLAAADLCDLAARAGADTRPDPGDARAVLRLLISSVRGVGYRLNLPASAIRFL